MKALVLQDKNKLVMQEMPTPIPKPNELLIKTKAATICTSDLNDIDHNPFGIHLPMIMGHEGSGDVVAVGDAVTDFKVGDEVVVHPVIPCYKCRSCKAGYAHLCDDMSHLGIDVGGVFAEYFTIRADRARIIPHNTINYATASLMEPVSVCIQAIKRGNVAESSDVLVVGDGPFGIIVTRLLSSYTKGKIILIGRHAFRLALATNALRINEKELPDVQQAIMDLTEGQGVDTAILCAGTSDAVNTCVYALKTRGTLSVFSAVLPNPSINLFKVHVKELQIHGSCNDENQMDNALKLLQKKELGLDQLVTHNLSFYSQWQEAFDLAKRGKDRAVKVSMNFAEGQP